MKQMLRRFLGIAFWLAVVIGAVKISAPLRSSTLDGNASIANYLSGPSDEVTANDPTGQLQIYDPVFMKRSDGKWRQVGYVRGKPESEPDNPIPISPVQISPVQISWYATDVGAAECQLIQYHDSGSLQTVITTMFPPQQQQQIQQRIADAMTRHGEELTRAFIPLVRKSIQQSLPVIEEEFRRSVREHRREIDGLADQWNKDIVDKRLIPLARREIMPIVRKHGQPVVEDIGRELWDRASLWRFGWRALYDKVPLPQRNLVQQEWERFAEQEAVPVFEKRMDDIVVAVQRTLRDVSANRKVRSEISQVAEELVQDPKTRELVRRILKETLVDNERLRKVWTDVWSTPEAKRALNLAGDRLEPIVRKIGDDLFGSEELGINPNFARVLRSQILRKDRRWIIAQRAEAPTDDIQLARSTMEYPIIYLADGDGAQTQ